MTITDWGVIYGSRVVVFKIDEDFMGAVDLRSLSPNAHDRIAIVEDRESLILADGRRLSADELRRRCLNPEPDVVFPAMTAAQLATWAEDGSDVHWELQEGIPVPRPLSRRGKTRVRMSFMSAVSRHLEKMRYKESGPGWEALMGVWICLGAESLNCRTPDVVVIPNDGTTSGESLWVENPAVICEIKDPLTDWLTERRLAFARSFPTIQEIVTIDWNCRWARIERRIGSRWTVDDIAADDVLAITTVGWTVPLADLKI